MLGDPAVGKTSLVRRFVNDMFEDKYISTIGAKPVKKQVAVGGDNLTMIIWDIAGQGYNLHPEYYAGAKGALMVCDMTRRSTLDSLAYWHSALSKKVGDVPVIVMANKSDLFDWDVSDSDLEGQMFSVIKTSARTGDNVEGAFQTLAEGILHG